MFKSARLKLTGWYLLIIMAITLSFSSVMYFGIATTTERALEVHDRMVERRLREFPRFMDQEPPPMFQQHISDETVRDIKSRVILMLGLVNLTILCVAGILGYWLAGVTLEPIEKMTDKQKKFVADAAHELKTPLTTMKTHLEVNLRNKKLTLAEAKDILRESVEDVDSLTLLANSLLKQSRYQGYKNGTEFETFNLKTLTNKVLKKLAPKIKEKKLELTKEMADIEVHGDKKAVEEVITIVLDNAIKFNKDKGNIKINLAEKDKKVALEIADTGSGISKNDLPHIFDRFYKADTSRHKTTHDGFGLGLSIAKEIVEMHKGHIEVADTGENGTTFKITFPKKE